MSFLKDSKRQKQIKHLVSESTEYEGFKMTVSLNRKYLQFA